MYVCWQLLLFFLVFFTGATGTTVSAQQALWVLFVYYQLSCSCRQLRRQPKATSITRERELSHTAHEHLQFLNLHVGTYFRHL